MLAGCPAVRVVRRSWQRVVADTVGVVGICSCFGFRGQYPLSDSTGNCAVVETVAYNASEAIPDPTVLVSNPFLKATLPSYAEIEKYSRPEYVHGAYIRRSNYTVPQELLTYNPGE